MIKINAHKIEYRPKNRHLFEIIIPRKQTKINNAVHLPTNPILNDEIKKIKRSKTKKTFILSMGKLIKPVN
jgi:hypothetical protein